MHFRSQWRLGEALLDSTRSILRQCKKKKKKKKKGANGMQGPKLPLYQPSATPLFQWRLGEALLDSTRSILRQCKKKKKKKKKKRCKWDAGTQITVVSAQCHSPVSVAFG
eukprot:TRINITY_DN5552_c1_g1_i1.p2 TRINITY_DN5552_c1_g1~~TRINITY_DN5552_c1_g1_i1.p2  ORF type:complete len:110 (+),score=2.49 TRINITY_DN5552_c1_g1_i1:151-480(+)